MYQDNNGDFVFRLKEVDGKWKVERSSVTVLDGDGRYTAIRRATSDEIQIAAFPSRTLQDGAEVKVVELLFLSTRNTAIFDLLPVTAHHHFRYALTFVSIAGNKDRAATHLPESKS